MYKTIIDDGLVFMYGTLKRGQPNHKILESGSGSAEFIAEGRTKLPYPLVVASRYNIPFLLHREGHGKNVWGDVYDVDGKMLSILDELEDHPSLYERMKIPVLLSCSGSVGQTSECWCYFLKKFKPALLQLPYLEAYSNSETDLKYVPSENLNNTDEI